MSRFLIFWVLLGTFCGAISATWPIKRRSFVDGDVILGGFFPIHGKDNDIMCGRLQDEGMVELEAMLFTVDQINRDSSILPGVNLGVLAVDSCDSVPKALEEAIDFAKGFIVKEDYYRSNLSRRFQCEGNSIPKYQQGVYEKVAAVIGGHSSWVSMQVADLMKIYRIPQVSYQSTNPALSDKHSYEYFFRTVAPLSHQVHAILHILQKFGWRYVSIVYADSPAGNAGFEVLKQFGTLQSICFSSRQRINVENSSPEDYDFAMANLLSKNATAVIIFGDHEMARNLISAATRAKAFDRFVWIGSTSWVSRDYVTSGNERTMEGAVGISFDIMPLKNFDTYLKSRSLKDHPRINPWFPEYWEEKLKCKLEDFDETPFNKNFTQPCSPDDDLPSACYLQATPAVQFVRDAVHAVARALHNMNCRTRRRSCVPFSLVDGQQLKTHLQQVTFEDEDGKPFQFDENGDGPPRYSIVNFQRTEGTPEYAWVPVGAYYHENGSSHLQLYKKRMLFKSHQPAFPGSLCSSLCQTGEAMIFLDEANCCWHCTNCTEYQYVAEGTACRDCPLGTLPTYDRETCRPIALDFIDFPNKWAVGCTVFSVFGILLSIAVAAAFWMFWDTPVFVASCRELSVVLLIGSFLSFNVTFALVAKPSVISCGVVRFFLGFCYTISYSAIAIKIYYVSRLSENQMSNKKPEPISIQSLVLITIALILVEGTINATWLLHSPPVTARQYPSRTENVLMCKGSDTAGYLVGLVYPFILMAFCTAYAFTIRDFKGAFNESRYINFSNYTTFVVWLGFLPMFLLNDSVKLRVVVLSLLLNLSALAQLVCLFLPKVYVAVRRPEKNKHETFMCHEVRQSIRPVD